MLGSYICRQCRCRLSRRIGPTRAPQWQPRATIVSFRPKARDDDEPTQPEAQSQARRDAVPDKSRDSPPIRNEGVNERSTLSRRPRQYMDDADAEVEDNVRQEAPAPTQSNQGPASVIEDALGRKNTDAAWATFQQAYPSTDCEALTNPPESDLAPLENGRVFTYLLRGVVDSFCSNRGPVGVTPTAVLLRYEQLGLARSEHWSSIALSKLTHRAMLAINGSPQTARGRELPATLSELLSVWRLFFQSKGPMTAPLEPTNTVWNLPANDALPDMFEHRDLGMRLQQFLPNYKGNAELTFCAVYLYTISEALSVVESLHRDAQPFIRFLERLLASSYVDSALPHVEKSHFKLLNPKIKHEIMHDINNAPGKAMSEIASRGETFGKEAPGGRDANLEAFYLRRIARGVLTTDSATRLNGLWREVYDFYKADGNRAIPRRIYNAFLSGFIVQLEAPRSVEVWNHMVAHGVKPDIQSWVALLDGCSKAKDLDGFNATWIRMTNSGIEPDNFAWTSRVHGLFSLGLVSAGLAALDDMGKRWLSAENAVKSPKTQSQIRKGAKNLSSSSKLVNNFTKPSIEVINAAVTALISLKMVHDKKIGFVQKILAWAGNFSIKPDAVTYNSLINLYSRAGQYSVAFKILRQMEVEGIEGDLATYSMLVTASFDNGAFNGLSEAQQSDKIIALFDSVEASGLKLNEYIYGPAIDRLLRQYSNSNAVRRIMEHMKARKVTPSARIYTFIITHYFKQKPPALTAADALVEHLFSSPRTDTDRYLFERVIDGYANHNEIGKMMSVVTRMSAKGIYPGWKALIAVLKALLQDGDYDRARDLLRDIEHGKGVAQGGVPGSRQDQNRFVEIVSRAGLRETDGPRWERRPSSRPEPEVDPFLDPSASTSAERADPQWLEPESTGNFTWNHRAPREGLNRTPATQQSNQQNWIAPEPQPHETDPYDAAQYEQEQIPTKRYTQDGAQLPDYEQRPEGEGRSREGRSLVEEDVHNFLTDEHDDYHSKVNRP